MAVRRAALAACVTFLAGAWLGTAQDTALPPSLAQVMEAPRAAFLQWAALHQKPYLEDSKELEYRYQVWQDHARWLAGQAARPPTSHSLGFTQFSDRTEDELRAGLLGQRAPLSPPLAQASGSEEEGHAWRYTHVTPPPAVNWTAKGVVGPIKNQHVNNSACGCCWAFATIGVVETAHALATGAVVPLSEQQLIDCDHRAPFRDEGCAGGDFLGGLEYVLRHGGVDSEADYPYLARDAKCHHKREKRRVVTIDGVGKVPPNNETALLQAVAQHPVGVALCVGPYLKEWHAYTGGVFGIPGCTEDIDHGMVVVGYGTEAGQDYWLLKNSWGAAWGEQGYLKLKRGLGGAGHCALASQPAFPIKKAPVPGMADGSAALTQWASQLADLPHALLTHLGRLLHMW